MNKTLLLIICDFLLISVLALVEFDAPEDAPPPAEEEAPQIDEGVNADMIELLQLSLEDEAARRAALAAQAEDLEAQKAALEEERTTLSSDLSMTQEERDRIAAEAARLEEQRAALAREREQLAAAKAQTEEQLAQTTGELAETAAERARIAENLETEAARARALQTELQARLTALEEAEQTVAQAEQRAAELEQQRERLATDLRISPTEREILSDTLSTARPEVEIARTERRQAEVRAEQLAQGVSQLAQSSEAMQEEIRRGQPISPNEIFRRFENNRLTLTFRATLPALFGTREETTRVNATLVQHDGRTFALFEGSRGPFAVDQLGRLRGVEGQFRLGDRRLEVVEVSFLAADPRVVAIELPSTLLAEAGLEPFPLAEDPFRFPEAVLISNELGVYGETDFRLLPGGQRYLSVERNLISQLAGNFQPSRGDYVFAQTGHLMGLMVEDERGVLLPTIEPTATLPLGRDFSAEAAGQLESRLSARLPRP